MEVGLFTTLMRTEFLDSMAVVGAPAEYERFTQVIPTTTRRTDFGWMTPAPGISEFIGSRRFATIDNIPYEVLVKEFDGAFTVPLIDIADDNVGGYIRRMRDLVMKSQDPFRSRLAITTLKNAGSLPCFDGSNFFSSTHSQGGFGSTPPQFSGGGGNDVTFTAASADGVTHTMIWLINNPLLKPLMYLEREAPKFMTNAGSPASSEEKKVKYWIDLRAGTGFGYWWDAIRVTITNTPTIPEMESIIDGIRMMARRFYLPTSLVTDPVERQHEQRKFTSENTTIVCSTGIEWILQKVLFQPQMGVTPATFTGGLFQNNQYVGFAYLVPSAILD